MADTSKHRIRIQQRLASVQKTLTEEVSPTQVQLNRLSNWAFRELDEIAAAVGAHFPPEDLEIKQLLLHSMEASQRELSRLQRNSAAEMPQVVEFDKFTQADLPVSTSPWPTNPVGSLSPPCPTLCLNNGYYSLFYPDGQLRFLIRIEAGKGVAWLNLDQSRPAGTLDESSCAIAFYPNGYRERFDARDDDSPPFPATISFQEWGARCLGIVCAHISAYTPQATEDLALERRCRQYFAPSPALYWKQIKPPDLRLPLLDVLRRLHFLAPESFKDRQNFLAGLEVLAAIPPEWALYLAGFLPLAWGAAERLRDDYPRLDWQGTFSCISLPVAEEDLVKEAVRIRADFGSPDLLEKVGQMQPLPLLLEAPPWPVCRLRLLALTCEQLLRAARPDCPRPFEVSLAAAGQLARDLGIPQSLDQKVHPWKDRPEELRHFKTQIEAADKLEEPMRTLFCASKPLLGEMLGCLIRDDGWEIGTPARGQS